MSMGVWNENAQTDETEQMRQAVRKAAEQAKLDKLAEKFPELVKTAEKVLKDTTRSHGGRRTKGTRRANQTLFPYRDSWANRNFRVVSCKIGETVIEYSPVRRYNSDQTVRPVRKAEETGEMAYSAPEWYVDHIWEESDRTLITEPSGRIQWERLIPYLSIPKRPDRPISEVWGERIIGDLYRLNSKTDEGFIPVGKDTSDLRQQAYLLLKADGWYDEDKEDTGKKLVPVGLMNTDPDETDEDE